jgi:hypothetical protein
MANKLLDSGTPDSIVRVLTTWRLWLAGALAGALLGAAWFALAPPPFRAQATVIVDMNLEEAWHYFTDRQLFQFMERESRKLEAIAWSDSVLKNVAAQFPDIGTAELRDNKLQLSQPADGAWHFWADDQNAQRAQDLAQAWATAFVEETTRSLFASTELMRLRAEIAAQFGDNNEPDQKILQVYFEEMALLLQDAHGILPYTEIRVSTEQDIPVHRATPQSIYLLGGSFIGASVAALLGLLLPKRDD